MIEIRHLTTFDEYEAALEVQRQVWGFNDVETVPSRLFLIANKVGGQVIGAFDGDRLAGFCFSIPGLKRGEELYLHSHMMGVLEEYRNQGVGRRLKLAQRDDALSRSVRLIEWTFDPLEVKNAYLNIERLGVTVRRYVLNQYGRTTSHLHSGMPTDRCVAEWFLAQPRTAAIIERTPFERELVEERIEVPSAIYEIRRRDVKEAIRIQRRVSEQFQEYLGRGLAVVGFERTEENCAYLLGIWK